MNTETGNKAVINDAFIDEVRAALTKNVYLRRRLPGWGRIHIDRQLPFLCVYRRPPDHPDAGTRRLLLGEAAYILAPGEPPAQAGLRRLVAAVTATQVTAFGATLLLELWAATEARDAPGFRIVAPRRHAPTPLLESLESALLSMTVDGVAPRVEVSYHETVAPPGLAPLLETAGAPAVWLIGIEVSPHYRDRITGELFPFELQELQRGLGHALKQVFYSFAHAYTSQRPAHHHMLGRRAMTSALQATDRQMVEVSERFDLLLHVTPVNAGDAWAEFRRRGFEQTPELHYRPRPVDPGLLKRQLYRIPVERIEDPTLAAIYAAKRDELDRQINMIADRNTPRFLRGSQQVYGEVEAWLLQLARQLVAQIPPAEAGEEAGQRLDAQAFAARAEAELAHYRRLMPGLPARVELRDDMTGIMVSRGHFLVARDACVAAARLDAVLAHEIGTHVVTYHNGQHQPLRLLHAGMANYEPLQEGLAVLAEFLTGQLDRERLRQLAGRVLAVHSLTQAASFTDTFRELTRRHGFAQRQAFAITLRVHRGGGFTKDAVYLRGLAGLLRYLGEGGDIERLYLGKIDLEQIHLIEELQWRKVLRPPPLRPRHLQGEENRARLAWLQQGVSLSRLVEACER